MDDSHLVSQTLQGDLNAFDALMARHQRMVYSIARQYVGSDDAMDVTQDVFLTAFQKLHSVASPDRLKHWLIRVTYNACASWTRKDRHLETLEDEPVSRSSMETALDQRENKRRLARMLQSLHPKHRLAVVLKYLEGYAIREIAEILETSEDVVKNMLYRSLRRLAKANP